MLWYLEAMRRLIPVFLAACMICGCVRAGFDPSAARPNPTDGAVVGDVITPKDGLNKEGLNTGAACLQGTLLPFGANIVGCSPMLPSFTQCDAATLCNGAAGWRLCTASEFLARTSGLKTGIPLWIASCVREDGVVTAPGDQICSSCAPQTAAPADLMWDCLQGKVMASDYSTAAFVGVIVGSACRRLGVNAANTEANWFPVAADQKASGALCCK